VDAIDGARDQRIVGGSRVSTGTPGNRPKGMSRPLEAAPSGSPDHAAPHLRLSAMSELAAWAKKIEQAERALHQIR